MKREFFIQFVGLVMLPLWVVNGWTTALERVASLKNARAA